MVALKYGRVAVRGPMAHVAHTSTVTEGFAHNNTPSATGPHSAANAQSADI